MKSSIALFVPGMFGFGVSVNLRPLLKSFIWFLDKGILKLSFEKKKHKHLSLSSRNRNNVPDSVIDFLHKQRVSRNVEFNGTKNQWKCSNNKYKTFYVVK